MMEIDTLSKLRRKKMASFGAVIRWSKVFIYHIFQRIMGQKLKMAVKLGFDNTALCSFYGK
jgi:hypothetical protein